MIICRTPHVAEIRIFVPAAFLLAVLGLLPATAHALVSSWNTNNSGAYRTAANWSNGVPGDDDIAVFDRGSAASYTVTFNQVLLQDVVSNRLIVGSNTVTFEPAAQPGNYFLNDTTTLEQGLFDSAVRGITIGSDATDTAAVLISHLSLLQAVAATLGHAAGSSGTLTLDQSNDVLNITGGSTTNVELIIGRLGTGILNVSAGADVTVNGLASGFPAGSVSLGRASSGQGTANISGAGSTLDVNTLLVVGDAGSGTLNVTAGGVVESLSGILGDLGGSTGTATISGAGSRWNVGALFVGDEGTGTLHVLDVGMVDVTIAGGSVNINGSSTLNLDNGTIDGNVNNAGQINVTGPATITGLLTIAVNADTLIDWGTPCCNMTFEVAGGVSNSGTFSVASTVERDVTIQLGHASFVNNATGVINLDGPSDLNADNQISSKHIFSGNVVNNGEMNVRTNAQITGSLTIAVNADTLIEPATPCCGMIFDVAGPITNSGTFTMKTNSASPQLAVELALGGTFTNNATGVVNLNGPTEVGEGETIESKHVISGTVVNNGQLNVRTNAQIGGSLTIAVDADTLIEPASPCCGMTLEVAGPVSNSGVFTMKTNSASPQLAVELAAGGTFTNNATGVVNLNGPTEVAEGETIESKHIIAGNVVNNGQLNVRTNTQITGSLETGPNSETVIEGNPDGPTVVQVAKDATNAGTLTLTGNVEQQVLLSISGTDPNAPSFVNTGLIRGMGTMDSSVSNHGTVRPGNSTGVLMISGDYTQESDGTLEVDVAGTTAGDQYDQLVVGGAIELNGLVEVVFADDFTPSVGDRFDVITTAASVTGTFVGASLPGLPAGMDWGIQYGANLVSLAIGIPGDYNANGIVDGADYTVWRDTLGQAGVFLAADGDGDDDVDADDYQFWKDHFGDTFGSGSGANANAAVPEPATWLLLVFAAGWSLRRRRNALKVSATHRACDTGQQRTVSDKAYSMLCTTGELIS